MLAHNAYPDHDKYADRPDRAIASGMPFAVEEDLAWLDGRSVVIHGAKNASPNFTDSCATLTMPLVHKIGQARTAFGRNSFVHGILKDGLRNLGYCCERCDKGAFIANT
jgi:hypothetical protein